ncbi:hypothetical protein ANO11243_072860 [Dothideomycetidae sp. 11243]|nr:hypothetical protein ANO11243_072860 [fungal sp. No.11243]
MGRRNDTQAKCQYLAQLADIRIIVRSYDCRYAEVEVLGRTAWSNRWGS